MPESTQSRLAPDVVRHVAETCLCLHSQRAARALGRLFDAALRPFGLTHGQFSLLMALNRAEPPTIGQLALFLAMDRTSLTAALKPLERKGLVRVLPCATDKRSRLLAITPEGVALLQSALPVWHATHGRIDADLEQAPPRDLRAALRQLTQIATQAGARIADRRT
ncbi:MarR family transcriptional regulator [Seohaeicola sp. SP36]|uniref:MarR family winged helix-turn-helix transcriptional regulator n=1 Tax=unclassified Seohaeicola TaxID=2641111 RepID=UPI00237AE75B|nr:MULTISPECIES: MarR family transcriptional regulator [unclassified Seohaeicola]MDD9709076.1 MarR family transcriptional regulator [Seohaeicola sp. 4SK31]MDD9737212.1 MarR family transcriptional regulator [Seohaeicola sp. SP36]